jgi:hypothetical protein
MAFFEPRKHTSPHTPHRTQIATRPARLGAKQLIRLVLNYRGNFCRSTVWTALEPIPEFGSFWNGLLGFTVSRFGAEHHLQA